MYCSCLYIQIYIYSTCIGPGTDYTIEGNVAAALLNLEIKCKASPAKLVDVLKAGGKNIHSFDDFNTKFKEMYNCAT